MAGKHQALGPAVDPNEHSYGSVPPIMATTELAHLEPGASTVGIQGYGRAPTFLLLTGYEQVRSVAAAIAGDMAAADNVQLVLPGGVCVPRSRSRYSRPDAAAVPRRRSPTPAASPMPMAKDEGQDGMRLRESPP